MKGKVRFWLRKGDGERPVYRYRWWIAGAAVVAVAGLVAAFLLLRGNVFMPATSVVQLPYSEFKQRLAHGEIVKVDVDESRISGELKSPSASAGKQVAFQTELLPTGDPQLVEQLDAAGIPYGVSAAPGPSAGLVMLRLLPLLLLCVAGYLAYRRASGTAGGLGSLVGMDKGRNTEVMPDAVSVTFQDVGGADEAIEELAEIIQFLKAPEKFARLGGRVPKGVLLIGPPGTGKTLLAKATAGEAGVRFFQTGGSEFMEMFVGVGPARVRSLFEQARKAAPAVVFIDEIDSIGQTRSGAGAVRSGANDEREQTLNQLLAEIDGFKTSTGKPVIIMAASNRPEVLDQALLRAGRFDRQVAVGQPDLVGRLQILKIHSRDISLVEDFDLERAARMTPGFTGADLANVINEAALQAARRGAEGVAMQDYEAAIERVVAGLEKKSRVMNERERTTIAYHESGHALIAGLVPNADPVAKISIIPRGRGALGYTMQMPTEDRYLLTREELEDRLAVILGGRAAEKIVLGTISTGASDDISKATDLARRMITEFGMSDLLGMVRYAGEQLQYLGSSVQDNSQLSPQTREAIDREIQRMITEQYNRATSLLRDNLRALHALTQRLIECESLDGSAVAAALQAANLLPT